jgi:hypothetical protein
MMRSRLQSLPMTAESVSRDTGCDAAKMTASTRMYRGAIMATDPNKELGFTPTVAGIATNGLQVGHGGVATQFKPGYDPRRASGRPKGSRSGGRSNVDLAQMILNNAARAGFKTLDENGKFIAGDGGCDGYLLWIALNDHRTYAALLARVLPYYVKVDLPENETMTHEETLAALRERGLPEDFIELMRKAPVVLDPDEIETYGPPKDVTP